MRMSTSMAEIATEDGTKEEDDEEEPASDERREGDDKEEGEEEEAAEDKSQTSSQSSSKTNVSPAAVESDSDTDDEDEEEVVTSSIPKSSAYSNQTLPQAPKAPALSASRTPSPPSASPAGGPSVISGITVTEATVPPGTPPSPGRCISVSSPGRGHKIFMVTRVECPPEQKQQQQPQKSAAAAPGLNEGATERPVDSNTPVTQQTPASQTPTQLSSPAPPADSKTTESPVSPLESAMSPAEPHSVEPQSSSRPSEEGITTRTLDSAAVTDQSPQTPALPSNSSSVPAEALLPTEGADEGSETPKPGAACVEVNKEGGEKELSVQHDRQVIPPESSSAEVEQLHIDQTSEEQLSPKQTWSMLSQQEVPGSETESEKPSSTQNEEPNQEEASPKQRSETELVPSEQTDQEEPEGNPDSADESSTDECFADALEGEVLASALPNGLKPEFSLHLLDSESPKPGSCVMEHGESLQALI